ncbi:11312_t:CDS:2 [Funneliformis caledonium]|uniref:11312_t:CDS:1 n=1 Tax=Funneliformis caledonium TaxID=1117310 RepID=A0A9N8ZZG2_9GLOM|nr:11312_t:CDS:2 [Funneliformis caledonium]
MDNNKRYVVEELKALCCKEKFRKETEFNRGISFSILKEQRTVIESHRASKLGKHIKIMQQKRNPNHLA